MDAGSRREREKQSREAEIVAAAEKIFYRKGFDGASMDEVAKEAQFTKRTLYQYFVNKEDLYFAVALKGFKQLLACFEAAINGGNTGFDKIRLSGLAYYQFYKDFPDAFRLLNRCRLVKEDISNYHQAILQMEQSMFQMFAAAIEKGKADGSIRVDLDAIKGAYFVVTVSIGFLNMVVESGKAFEEYFGLNQEDFVLFTLDLLCDAIRAPGR